jgi:hypothetical protein
MNKTHGHSPRGKAEATYRTWICMKSRCNNPKQSSYSYYGGRGIKICPEWNDNFQNFLNDMGVRPKGKTLDRINNDGNYEPKNCRWATIKQQNTNRDNTNCGGRLKKTHCLHGHLYDSKNTMICRSKKRKNSYRKCKTCDYAQQKKSKNKKRGELT